MLVVRHIGESVTSFHFKYQYMRSYGEHQTTISTYSNSLDELKQILEKEKRGVIYIYPN